MQYELGFLGCGNMGGALLAAAAERVPAGKIAVFDPDTRKTDVARVAHGVHICASADELAASCRFFVVGVKPQVLPAVLRPLGNVLDAAHTTVVSMAAGTSIAAIRTALGRDDLPVIRIMPNTPAAVGHGLILYATADVADAEEATFLSAFAAAGQLDRLPEEKIDAASALSGCGPAFVYLFIEALADGAVECGLSREKALLYAAKTVEGAAEMVCRGGHPAVLKDAVCSPGGTTIAGVHALESNAFRAAAMDAVVAAYQKTLSLH